MSLKSMLIPGDFFINFLFSKFMSNICLLKLKEGFSVVVIVQVRSDIKNAEDHCDRVCYLGIDHAFVNMRVFRHHTVLRCGGGGAMYGATVEMQFLRTEFNLQELCSIYIDIY